MALAALAGCEQSETRVSEKLVFAVQASIDETSLIPTGSSRSYTLQATREAFIRSFEKPLQADSAFTPHRLTVKINLLAGLVETLTNSNGYRARTQIELEDGEIKINHTSQANLVVSQEGDSLYAIYGEGIVSGGTERFENISGLFYEQSMYRIIDTLGTDGQPTMKVTRIKCRYDLLVDY
ncbi:MAG: hypothetical protein U9P14_00520 [Gemmatimonadota bacterium]|nr:hypothetical protein [Gemmatimonadota bacterium]